MGFVFFFLGEAAAAILSSFGVSLLTEHSQADDQDEEICVVVIRNLGNTPESQL